MVLARNDIPPLSKNESNLYQLIQALLQDVEVPSIERFSPYGDYNDVATGAHQHRVKAGVPGVQAYIKSFNNLKRKTTKDKRIIWILSGNTPGQAAAVPDAPAPVGTLLSDVKPEKISWLWKYRMALGKLTMLDGDPGLGKSNITLDLAARLSTGREMPDGAPGIPGGAGVVLITPEDGLADTIVPRLARAGANLKKIVSIGKISTTDVTTGYTYDRPFTLPDDLPLLEAAIERVQAKLVIIDPVMAVLGGGKDSYKDNEVRSILAPIQMLIEKADAACVLVRHLNKSGGDNALYRGGGSIAFIGLARCGLMVLKEPTEEGRTVLAHVKSNIGKIAPTLAFRVVSDEDEGDERPYIQWEGESTHSIKELMAPASQKPSSIRMEILEVLQGRAPEAISPQEVADALPERSKGEITVALKRMTDAGQVQKSARGMYYVDK